MSSNEFIRCQPHLGTYVEITIGGDASDEEKTRLSAAAFAEIARVETLLSFHSADSELTRANQTAHLSPAPIGDDFRAVLAAILDLAERSNGLFDPTVGATLVRRGILPDHGTSTDPQRSSWRDIVLEGNTLSFTRPLAIDLGGIAKGYAVDRAIELLAEANCPALINAGGDLRSTDWQQRRVSLRVPGNAGHLIELEMPSPAVASSSADFLDGEPVILDPRDQRPATETRAVSVFAPTCMIADALTKIATLSRDISPILTHFDASALYIDPSGQTEVIA